MSWQQLICHTTGQYQDKITDTLEKAGAASITFQDAADKPILEPLPGETPLWENLIITALFPSDINLSPLLNNLQKQDWEITNLQIEILEDQNWERAWMDDFKPMRFGNNLWIYPTTHERPDDSSTQIVLDPGLAFGTGTHPTTALCLEWLDYNPPTNQIVIDYGCGSGILAIAAAKLNAQHIIATDIDEQAILATCQNMQRNNIPQEMIQTCFPDQLPDIQADILIANILSGPLTELSLLFATLLKPRGKIVLSGILREQEKDIIQAYEKNYCQLISKESADWIRITGERKKT
jgi:ribosomal protein L11 methyltransferase